MDIIKKLQFKYLQAKYSLKLISNPSESIVINGVFHPHGVNLMNENWGDDINTIVPKLLTGKDVIPFNLLFPWIRNRLPINYMCIGSIINWLTTERSIIWGSGVISRNCCISSKPKAVTAVRGPLTRDYLLGHGIPCPKIYGDPALLLPNFYTPTRKIQYHIGFIPHISENTLDIVKRLDAYHDVKVIYMNNYNSDWKYIINQICECEIIVSSSLHGLIVSEAYNIPNVWVKLSDNLIGGDFKFQDFFKSIGKERDCIRLNDCCSLIKRLEQAALSWKKKRLDLTQQLIDSCPFI